MVRIALAVLVLGSVACGSTPARAPVAAAWSPRPVTAAARIRFEAGEAPADVQALTGGWIADGLPALSGDGNTLAIVELGGNGIEDYAALLMLSARDASIVQRVPLFAWSAADDVDDTSYPAFVASLPPAMTAADALLTRGDYRALVPIPNGEAPPDRGLIFTDDGVVTLHDTRDGRLRFEGRVTPVRPEVIEEPPEEDSEDTDDGEYDEYDEGEDPCAERSLELASAWSIDSTHMLLQTMTNNAADECYVEHAYRIVELLP